mmetsp:Transcript_25451/g.56359  ORF Transcript_25451/g.56359 Transcript_25451/m.56359 type:complete len:237 (+) Transcript_25451:151-861(+)|eukprot:CAMPEP_0173185284 /NCGR_PEP_ID=MMETSP1141-20130122/9465_1 /TAXON_ID=483371 /ORGANISM="non described non described, Strain CCMP2298" /LENGTH=236 /DNA_ID=CAMNT_0014108787 /DNA_START=88 /DNA_END=798 /DNA_ORIENTATION=-
MSKGKNEDMSNLDVVERYETYEDYLDSQLTSNDMGYLEDEEMARQLVELGYRGLGDTIRREDFEARKKLLVERTSLKHSAPKKLASVDKDLALYPFLKAIAEREELVRTGKLTTIVFIRDFNSKGQEVSGYIDLAHRMRTEDFVPIFEHRKKLLPKPADLSYYNWETQLSTSNSTPHYQVIADSAQGLLFKNKRDRKIVNVNPESKEPGDNTTRVELVTSEYTQVVLYDHSTRRRL